MKHFCLWLRLSLVPSVFLPALACGSADHGGSADGETSSSSSGDGSSTNDASSSSSATSTSGGNSSSNSSGSTGGSGGSASNGTGGTDASSTDASSTATTGAGGASVVPPFQQQWQNCESADDCVFIRQETCCGCVLVGVNREYEVEADESLVDANIAECGDVGCATQGCAADPVAACESGICVERPGCSTRNLTDCESDDTCRVYSARNCQRPEDEIVPGICGTPPESETCSEGGPTCRVNSFGVMLLFENACVPSVGYEQACPVECG